VIDMRVAIVYGSRLGATRGIAEFIAQRLGAAGLDADLYPAERLVELPSADAFIIGSGVYGQHWMKEAAELVRRNERALSAHPVWLFSSGPIGRWSLGHDPVEPREIARLRRTVRPRDHRVFSGALDNSTLDAGDLSRVERFVSRRFLAEGDFRDWPAIEAWADGIARRLSAV
jgi:menaquinone-dependent protoporphyrinogen oxidase